MSNMIKLCSNVQNITKIIIKGFYKGLTHLVHLVNINHPLNIPYFENMNNRNSRKSKSFINYTLGIQVH